MAAHVVKRYRLRVERRTAETGEFAWAALDAFGNVLHTGTSDALPPERGACELVLPSDVVLLHRLAVPPAQRRRLSGALHFLVEDLLLSDPERVHVAEASRSAKDALCVAIVERAWLKEVLARIAGAGFKPERALAETLLPPIEPGTWSVVWSAEGGFARTGAAEGFALDRPDDGSAPVALRLALERSAPGAIVLYGAGDTPAPDAERWSQELDLPVRAAGAWRWAQGPAEQALDLLQGEFSLRRDANGWRTGLKRPAALAAALLIVSLLGIGADWASKARERKALVAEMNALYRQTFGANAVVVDAPLQMQRALADLKRRNGEAAPSDFLPLLAVLGSEFLDPATQRLESISYQRGKLAVVLQPREPAGFAALLETLRGKSAIPGLAIQVDAVESGSPARLRLTVSTENGRWALATP